MKKIVIASLLAAPALALTACGGGTTTENTTVADNAVITEGETATENLGAVEPLNDAGYAANLTLDNASTGNEAVIANDTLGNTTL